MHRGGGSPQGWRGRVVRVLWGLALPASVGVAGASQPEVLPRSIYVPVRIEAGPCLREVVVRTEDGQVRAAVPGRLVSQFAFHDGREGPHPAWERLTVEGWIVPATGDADGARERRRFRAGIVITPTSIYVGSRRLDLGTLEEMERFRRRLDLRMPERTLRLRPRECSGVPGRAAPDPEPAPY